MRRLPTAIAAAGLLLLVGRTPVSAGIVSCVGDCDGGETVSVDELITMISIALGERDFLDCKSGDGNDNGAIEVDDLVTAVNNALNGCRAMVFKTHIDHPFEP